MGVNPLYAEAWHTTGLHGGAVLVVAATSFQSPGWGVEIAVALVAAAVAAALGAPGLLILVAVPIRFGIPGPFHSVSVFEVALPFALAHEAVLGVVTVPRLRPAAATVGVLVTWLLLSGIWAVDPLLWLRSVIVLGEALVVGLTFYLWTQRRPIAVVLRSWVLLGAFASIAAIVWYHLLRRPEWINLMPPRNADEAASQLERLGSPFWGPSNYFASMLLLFIPFGLSSRVKGWLRVALIGAGAIAIIGTLSRGAALAVVVALPFLFFVVPRSRRPRLPFDARWLIAPVSAAIAIQLWQVIHRPDLRFNFLNDPARASYYESALRLLTAKPIFGAGYGTWPSLVTGTATTGVHNYYLQVAVETGLIGAALFTAAFAALVLRTRKLAGELGFMATAALLLVAVNITVEASFEGETFSWLFAMLVGMMFAWPTGWEDPVERSADPVG